MMESTISTDKIKLFLKKIDELVNIENKKKGWGFRRYCHPRK